MELEDAIRERDECSKAGMELIELCRRLIEKLKSTRYSEITKRGKRKSK
jgi:hypothetical protein